MEIVILTRFRHFTSQSLSKDPKDIFVIFQNLKLATLNLIQHPKFQSSKSEKIIKLDRQGSSIISKKLFAVKHLI